jgi:hypothetical protein
MIDAEEFGINPTPKEQPPRNLSGKRTRQYLHLESGALAPAEGVALSGIRDRWGILVLLKPE